MQTLSCPIPDNINPLQSNGFTLDIIKLPEIKYFCQTVRLPSILLRNAVQSTPFVDIPVPGDKPLFGDLEVSFMIDTQMSNYIALHNWLIGMGFPEDWSQYTDFINSRTTNFVVSDTSAATSDAVLTILGPSSTPVKTVHFTNAFPVSLTNVDFMSTVRDTTYLVASATFKYTNYRFT